MVSVQSSCGRDPEYPEGLSALMARFSTLQLFAPQYEQVSQQLGQAIACWSPDAEKAVDELLDWMGRPNYTLLKTPSAALSVLETGLRSASKILESWLVDKLLMVRSDDAHPVRASEAAGLIGCVLRDTPEYYSEIVTTQLATEDAQIQSTAACFLSAKVYELLGEGEREAASQLMTLHMPRLLALVGQGKHSSGGDLTFTSAMQMMLSVDVELAIEVVRDTSDGMITACAENRVDVLRGAIIALLKYLPQGTREVARQLGNHLDRSGGGSITIASALQNMGMPGFEEFFRRMKSEENGLDAAFAASFLPGFGTEALDCVVTRMKTASSEEKRDCLFCLHAFAISVSYGSSDLEEQARFDQLARRLQSPQLAVELELARVSADKVVAELAERLLEYTASNLDRI